MNFPSSKPSACGDFWAYSDRLPLGDVVTYWCQQSGFSSEHCREAKTAAILTALRAGGIEYSRSDGKTFQDDLGELAAKGLLLIERSSFDAWAAQFGAPALKQVGEPCHLRSETTYLNIIGAMLELIQSPRPGRDSEGAVIAELVTNYAYAPGIAKSTLEGKFRDAKRSLRAALAP